MESTYKNEVIIDPPNVTVDNLRDFIANDTLFTEYLNIFLALPIFPVAYYYNNNSGLFRVETSSKLSRLCNTNSKETSFQLLLIKENIQGYRSRRASTTMSNLVLNKKKGLQWIQKERLHLFLQSQLYAEYRLARIFSQIRLSQPNHNSTQALYTNIFPLKAPPASVISPICDDDDDDTSIPPSETKTESVLLLFGSTNQNEIDSWYKASQESDVNRADYCDDSLKNKTSKCVMLKDMDAIRPVVCSPVYLVPNSSKSDVPRFQISSPAGLLHLSNVQELSWMLIAAVVKSAIMQVENVTISEVQNSLAYQTLFPFNHMCASDITINALKKTVYLDELPSKTTDTVVSANQTDRSNSEKSPRILSMDDQKDKFLKSEYSEKPFDSFSTYASIMDFQSFLKKKPSEMNWFLWIDLEKFRLSQTEARKEISILTIKNRYYETRAQYELPVNLKNEIDIVNWKSLTKDKVFEIQRRLLEPFLKYWVPSYLLKKENKTNLSKYANYFAWENLIQRTTQTFVQELDQQDVSIFVLKSPYPEQKKTIPMLTQMNPSNIVTLSPNNPKCGMRRTLLVDSVQPGNASIKRHDLQTVTHKRNNVPDMKTPRNTELKSSFMHRDTENLMKSFHSANSSLPSHRQDMKWSHCPIQIEPFNFTPPLPKELNCVNILTSNWDDTEASKHKDLIQDAENMDKYKLLVSLFNALTSEGASGDIFAVYVRRECNMKSANCLMLWNAIRKFLCLFYDQPTLWPKITKQVKIIYSEYLSTSSKRNVGCNKCIVEKIRKQIDSPTGDMFNYVAENVLAFLIPCWKQYLLEEKCKILELLNN